MVFTQKKQYMYQDGPVVLLNHQNDDVKSFLNQDICITVKIKEKKLSVSEELRIIF